MALVLGLNGFQKWSIYFSGYFPTFLENCITYRMCICAPKTKKKHSRPWYSGWSCCELLLVPWGYLIMLRLYIDLIWSRFLPKKSSMWSLPKITYLFYLCTFYVLIIGPIAHTVIIVFGCLWGILVLQIAFRTQSIGKFLHEPPLIWTFLPISHSFQGSMSRNPAPVDEVLSFSYISFPIFYL